VTQHLNGCFK